MFVQLRPTIPLDTPKGPADAHGVIDYGSEAPLLFVCFVRATGECWTFPNTAVRLETNVTGGVRARFAPAGEEWGEYAPGTPAAARCPDGVP